LHGLGTCNIRKKVFGSSSQPPSVATGRPTGTTLLPAIDLGFCCSHDSRPRCIVAHYSIGSCNIVRHSLFIMFVVSQGLLSQYILHWKANYYILKCASRTLGMNMKKQLLCVKDYEVENLLISMYRLTKNEVPISKALSVVHVQSISPWKNTDKWQSSMMSPTLTTTALRRWFLVDREILYIPITGSGSRRGVNHSMYARGWGNVPSWGGSVNTTRTCATRSAVKDHKKGQPLNESTTKAETYQMNHYPDSQ
jgi:hypothetical protein